MGLNMSKELKIGNLELKNRVIIGPMAGVSNQGFRAVIKEFDPALIYSEMISDKAIHFKICSKPITNNWYILCYCYFKKFIYMMFK